MPVNILRIAEALKIKDVFKLAAKITCREILLRATGSSEEIWKGNFSFAQ